MSVPESPKQARKRRSPAKSFTLTEVELLDSLFEGFKEELNLAGPTEIGIGRRLAQNEVRLRNLQDCETHQFEIAEARALLETTDRYRRNHFAAFFLRKFTQNEHTPLHRLPAYLAEQFLVNLRAKIESGGIPVKEDLLDPIVFIYGREMDDLGGAVIFHCAQLERLQNNTDTAELEKVKEKILQSIDAAIEVEKVRKKLQSFAESLEFADDVPVLPADDELGRIHRLRISYERERRQLLDQLQTIRRLKGAVSAT